MGVMERDSLWRFFGTIPRACYTLFCAITAGIAWKDAADALEQLPWINLVIFIGWVAFGFFAFLNVITGFFCVREADLAERDREELVARQMLDRKVYMQDFKDIFEKVDTDHSGDL